MSIRNRKRAGMGQCDEEMSSVNQDIIEVSSQSETEGGTRRMSSRMKGKVVREEVTETENSGGDGSELEVVSVQRETESERRISVRHQGKNVSDQGKTGGSCVEYESDSRMKKSRNLKGAKKEMAEVDKDSDAVSQIETDGKSRRGSVRNKSKTESSKVNENESTEDREQNNQRRTRSRNTSVSAVTNFIDERASGQDRKWDRNTGIEPDENRPQNQRPRRSTQKLQSGPNSSRGKKAYTEVDTGDSSEEKATEMEVESDFQEQDKGSAGKNEPDLLNMVGKAEISSTLPGKNGHSKSKSYKNEGTFKRKKNLKHSQNIDIEEEMVDEQHDNHEEKKDVELEPSTRSEDKEKEMMKNENLMESLNGEKHIKDQTDKSGCFVADGFGYASLQTTPNEKAKSVTPDRQKEAGKSENPEKDDSLHVNETPVKENDVDNISTFWPALSGAVDVSTDRTRHLSSISTKSDKSNCSDLSAIFSPIKDLKDIEGEDEKTERLPVKREISGDFENKKRKRLSEPAFRKRRRR